MWRQCGAWVPGMPDGRGSAPPRSDAPRDTALTRGTPDPAFHSVAEGEMRCENFANCKVDKSVTPRLYSPHNGAPIGFGVMARLRSTSLIVVTRHPTRSDVLGFGGSPVLSGRGIARSPGCLTTESEERETWTAKSLRTASHMRAIVCCVAVGRDFGGTRFGQHQVVVGLLRKKRNDGDEHVGPRQSRGAQAS